MSKDTEIISVSSPTGSVCDVVFVHGLDGDVRNTWCHDATRLEDSWPQWLASEFPRAAVWLVGYDGASLKWFGAGMPIIHRATNLLSLFEIHGIGKRPAIFIGHSMGGLLIKQMLRNAESYAEKGWADFGKNTQAVIFVSTPHLGSAVPGYVDALRVILRPAASIKDLHANDSALSDLNTWFRTFVKTRGLDVLSFHETQRTKGAMVVDEASSDFGFPGIISRPIDADHIQVCKPDKATAIVPALSSVRIRQIVNRLSAGQPKTDSVAEMSFSGVTEINGACIDALRQSDGTVAISYHPQILQIVSRLAAYTDDPTPLLAKIPYMRTEKNDRKRQEAAAAYHAGISETNAVVQKSIRQNREYLELLLMRLRRDKVSDDVARDSLTSFASFAALRTIRNLKEFYDVEGDRLVRFFEHFVFNQDPCYCYLDWVPRSSDTGRRVFGYSYYVGARVGPSESHYEYVMLPLDVGRSILVGGGEGDAGTFHKWVLPQLYVVGSHHGADAFPAADWQLILLQGAAGEEWQTGIENDPWPGLQG